MEEYTAGMLKHRIMKDGYDTAQTRTWELLPIHKEVHHVRGMVQLRFFTTKRGHRQKRNHDHNSVMTYARIFRSIRLSHPLVRMYVYHDNTPT